MSLICNLVYIWQVGLWSRPGWKDKQNKIFTNLKVALNSFFLFVCFFCDVMFKKPESAAKYLLFFFLSSNFLSPIVLVIKPVNRKVMVSIQSHQLKEHSVYSILASSSSEHIWKIKQWWFPTWYSTCLVFICVGFETN